MTTMEAVLSESLIHFIWQGTATGVLLWFALYFLRRRSANARYLVSCVALLVMALAPLVTAWVLYEPVLPSQRLTAPGFAAVASVRWLEAARVWALPVWAAGVLLFALRLIASWNFTRKLRATGAEAEAGLRTLVASVAARIGVQREIQVLLSTLTEMPSAIGWLRPVVLLPGAAISGLTPQQLEAVIAHELAHIRRHDYLINVVQTVVETLLFYHPMVWWVSAQIRNERELCCDDVAVALHGDSVEYARALTVLEKQRGVAPSLAMGSLNGSLLQRVRRLLNGGQSAQAPSRLVAGAAVLVGVVCLAVTMGWAQSRGDKEPPKAQVKEEIKEREAEQAEVQKKIDEALRNVDRVVQDFNGNLGRIIEGEQGKSRIGLYEKAVQLEPSESTLAFLLQAQRDSLTDDRRNLERAVEQLKRLETSLAAVNSEGTQEKPQNRDELSAILVELRRLRERLAEVTSKKAENGDPNLQVLERIEDLRKQYELQKLMEQDKLKEQLLIESQKREDSLKLQLEEYLKALEDRKNQNPDSRK